MDMHNEMTPGAAQDHPRKARPVELQRHATVTEAVAAAFSEAHAQFISNVDRLSPSYEPEVVHRARVAIRRLRVWLRLFRSRLGKEPERKLTRGLRWLFRLIGVLRDAQVFEASYLTRVQANPRAIQSLEARLADLQQAAQQRLAAALVSERFQALYGSLAALQTELSTTPAGKRQARSWLKRRLQRRHQRAARRELAVYTKDPAKLHALRKELKKLRYTAELAQSLYPRRQKRVHRYLNALKNLQDVLGEYMDQEVARHVLNQLATAKHVQVKFNRQLDQSGAARTAELTVAFPCFARAKPFWK